MLNFKRILIVFTLLIIISSFLIGYFSVVLKAKQNTPDMVKAQSLKLSVLNAIKDRSNVTTRTTPTPSPVLEIPTPLANMFSDYLNTPAGIVTSIPKFITSGIRIRPTPTPRVKTAMIPRYTVSSTVIPQPIWTERPKPIVNVMTPTSAYVNSAVFSHTQPLTNSTIITTLQKGESVTVVESTSDGWYKLSDGSYVYKSFISLNTGTPPKKMVDSPEPLKKSSRGDDGRVYEKPHTLKVDTISNLTKNEISTIIRNTNFKNSADAIYDCERQYNINAFFIVGTAKEESANGFSSLAKSNYNLFGIKGGTSYKHFGSFSESFYGFSKLIRNYYFNKGLTTLSSIQRVYCENSAWDENIYNIMKCDFNKVK